MRLSLAERGIRGVVLDVEGTTTPIAFVHNTLFRYARAYLRRDVHARDTDAGWQDAFRLLRQEQIADAFSGDLAAYVEWLMDGDRKSPGLKQLQGKIWERGYRDGALRGEVFPDVAPALRRWRAAGIDVAIFSSGSVLAQRLLFGSTAAGDLTEFIQHYFDTAIGPKQSAESYRRIAEAMHRPSHELLFISDIVAELEAARAAGMHPVLSVRPGNSAQPANEMAVIESFDDVNVVQETAPTSPPPTPRTLPAL